MTEEQLRILNKSASVWAGRSDPRPNDCVPLECDVIAAAAAEITRLRATLSEIADRENWFYTVRSIDGREFWSFLWISTKIANAAEFARKALEGSP